MSGGAGRPVRRDPERLLALIREEGAELVPDWTTAEDGGIYRLGDAVFVAEHGAAEPTGPFESLLEALEAVGEEALRSGENVVWRWRDAAITVEEGEIRGVCGECEWLFDHGETVLSLVVDAMCNSSRVGVSRWHDFYFMKDDDGLFETGLHRAYPSLEAAWSSAYGGLRFPCGAKVQTWELPPLEVARRFRWWQDGVDEPIRINGQLYWLQGEGEEDERGERGPGGERDGGGEAGASDPNGRTNQGSSGRGRRGPHP